MATGVVLDALTQSHADEVMKALKADFGVDTTQKEFVSAAVFGMTAAQMVGMLIAFTKAKAARDDPPPEPEAATNPEAS
jgi:hypothetical protein